MGHRWKRLRRVTVTKPGDQYVAPPTITVDPPAAPKQEAQGTADLLNGTVNSINLDSGGNFYATTPEVTLSAPDSGGTQATAVATIQAGEVSAVTITDPGSGYSTPPTVTIAKSTDEKSLFAAQVNIEFDSATGTVTKVNVTDSGNFYDSENPPNISISAPFADTSFERGEDVTIQADGSGNVVSGEVAQWIDSSQKLSLIHTANSSGTFVEPSTGLVITGSNSSASRKITKVERPEIAGDVSDEFDVEAQDFLDFSESNPFGEPEAATLVQEAAAAAVVASTPADKMVIKGGRSDPPFHAPKSYKIVANGVSYNFVSNDDDRNFYQGIRDLNVPGLEISSYDSGGIISGFQISYTAQSDSDTLTIAGDGFAHVGMTEGNYVLNTADANAPTSSPLQPGDSAPIRPGDSDFIEFMKAADYQREVNQSQTSMIWDSAAGNLGMSNITYAASHQIDHDFHLQTSSIVFGNNGAKLYYGDQGTGKIYSRQMSTAYDITSIFNQGDSAAFDSAFDRVFAYPDSDTYIRPGGRFTSLAFNPQGTKMWIAENYNDAIAQFDLADSWDINTATLDKGYTSTYPGSNILMPPFTYDYNFPGGNNVSMDWFDSGRKLALTKLGTTGEIRVAEFTTPYDIGSFSTSTSYTNGIPLTPASGFGNSPMIPRFEYKLAFTTGSLFNKDGTRRYFIHRSFEDSDYDSSSSGNGNGLNGWRATLVRTDLSSAYDLSTMNFHSQIEITNRGELAQGAPSQLDISGFAIHPNGERFFAITERTQNLPDSITTLWSGSGDDHIIEYVTAADSAGTPIITRPDMSVKPFVAADSDDAWAEPYLGTDLTDYKDLIDDSSPHYRAPYVPPSSTNYSIDNIGNLNDSGNYVLYGREDGKTPISGNWASNVAGERVWMEFAKGGTKLYVADRYHVGYNVYNLSTAYDIDTATEVVSEAVTDFTALFTSKGYSGGLVNNADGNFKFNDAGDEVTILYPISGSNPAKLRTFSLSTPFDMSTIVSNSLVETSFIADTALQNTLAEVTANNRIYAGRNDVGIFALSDGQFSWLDSGKKLGITGGANNATIAIYDVPTPYDHSSITFSGTGHNLYSALNLYDVRDAIGTRTGWTGNFGNNDFSFSRDGKTLYQQSGYGGRQIFEYKLDSAYNLGSIDSADVNILYEPNDTLAGGLRLSNSGYKSIRITPNGRLHVGFQGYYDSSDTLTSTAGIMYFDLTTNRGEPPGYGESDNSFFSSFATNLISTVNTGTLYTGTGIDGNSGNVYYLAIDEGVIGRDESDGSFFTDSNITVSISLDDQYGGGYGNVFQFTPVEPSEAVAWGGTRGLFAGDEYGRSTSTDRIDYITIDTTGNAQDFGNLATRTGSGASISSVNRGLFAGGRRDTNYEITDIQYVTPGTLGNAVSSGNLSNGRRNHAGCGDGTTGLTGGGMNQGGTRLTTIDYITISTLGTAQSFGSLTAARASLGALANSTYAVWGGGILQSQGSGGDNTIDYVTIATPGNATDFGDYATTSQSYGSTGTSNETYGLFAGGYGYYNQIERIVIDTPGNAVDFGDLSNRGGSSPYGSHHMGAATNGNRGVFAGGGIGGASTNTIDYVVISTPGNAQDFGDRMDTNQMIYGISGGA